MMARTGCLSLKENLARWRVSDAIRDLCNNGVEDLPHFLFLCPALQPIRVKFYNQLELRSKSFDAESVWLKHCGASISGQLNIFIGEYACDFGNVRDDIFDTISKQFLAEAWDFRHESTVTVHPPVETEPM